MTKPRKPPIDLPLNPRPEAPASRLSETMLKASVVLTIYLDVQVGPEPARSPDGGEGPEST